jgi:uncharacterized protein (UPF0218 family)
MKVIYRLKSNMRSEFKKPFGELIEGTFDETAKQLKIVVDKNRPTCIIAVGDAVSKNIFKNGIFTKVVITDNRSLRKEIPSQNFPDRIQIVVENPQETITREAVSAIKKSFERKGPTHILVKGEEDLLTLASVAFAPENSMVIYGQPSLGMVVVTVDSQKKKEAKRILDTMKVEKV